MFQWPERSQKLFLGQEFHQLGVSHDHPGEPFLRARHGTAQNSSGSGRAAEAAAAAAEQQHQRTMLFLSGGGQQQQQK
jgi:hypothetical protein